jgi:hypothetical protein
MPANSTNHIALQMRLPGALLVLAAAGRPETQAAAAAVLRQLSPLSDYGRLPGAAAVVVVVVAGAGAGRQRSRPSLLPCPALQFAASNPPHAGELPGKPDAEARLELGRRLLAVQMSATHNNVNRVQAQHQQQQQPLCLLPLVGGFLQAVGLGEELLDATEGVCVCGGCQSALGWLLCLCCCGVSARGLGGQPACCLLLHPRRAGAAD